jgi:hypothetical protein
MMEEMMLRYEAFARHAPYIEKLCIDQNRVVLKDNRENIHVGFVYSLPELYNDKIKAPPRSAYEDMS